MTELTSTPPVTLDAILRANPFPGSKKPDPDVELPVMVTFTDDWPAATLELAEEGVAGGGATSLATTNP